MNRIKIFFFATISLICSNTYTQEVKLTIEDSVITWIKKKSNTTIVNYTLQMDSSIKYLNFYFFSEIIKAIDKEEEDQKIFVGLTYILRDTMRNYYYNYWNSLIIPIYNKEKNKLIYDKNNVFEESFKINLTKEYNCYKGTAYINFPVSVSKKGVYEFYLVYKFDELDKFNLKNQVFFVEPIFKGYLKSNTVKLVIK